MSHSRRLCQAITEKLHRCHIRWYQSISTLRMIGAPDLHQPLHAVGAGTLEIRGKVSIGFFPSPGFFERSAYIEARYRGSRVVIDENTWINNGFVAIAEYSTITIGKRCRIGANVEMIGSDFHGLAAAERGLSKPEWNRAIIIEDDVFIGSNAKIMKGVVIGKGAVVGNGAVVTKEVPSYCVVAGNPASIIKQLGEPQ